MAIPRYRRCAGPCPHMAIPLRLSFTRRALDFRRSFVNVIGVVEADSIGVAAGLWVEDQDRRWYRIAALLRIGLL